MCGEKMETFNLVVSKTMQVNNNVKRCLQILCRRLPSASTSMSLMVSRNVVRIGALHGIVIVRFIATRLPYCVGALTTVRRIYTRHHRSCLGALPINPSVESRIYITISRNIPGGARESWRPSAGSISGLWKELPVDPFSLSQERSSAAAGSDKPANSANVASKAGIPPLNTGGGGEG